MDDQKIKVLIADDNEAMVESTQMLLDIGGFTTLSAFSGRDVLATAAQELPHIILLDMHMGDMEGVEICKTLKEKPETSDIAVILVSGDMDIEQAMTDAGAQGYIEKPFSMEQLFQTIRNHV